MLNFATSESLLKLLPYMASCCPEYDVYYVWHKDGRFGFQFEPKTEKFDTYGRMRMFEILVVNDFDFELNNQYNMRVNIGRFVKYFRLGLIAIFGTKYKSLLQDYLFEKAKSQNYT